MTTAANPFAPPDTGGFPDVATEASVVDWDLRFGELPAACVATNRTDNIYCDWEHAVSRSAAVTFLLMFVPLFGLLVPVLQSLILPRIGHAVRIKVWRRQSIRWMRFAIMLPSIFVWSLGNAQLGIGICFGDGESVLYGLTAYVIVVLSLQMLAWTRLCSNCELLNENTIRINRLHPGYRQRVADLQNQRSTPTEANSE